MAPRVTADWPIFVKTEADKIRWKACLDYITAELGLEFPRDIDMLNIFARSAFHNPEIPTEGLLSLTQGTPFNPNPEVPLVPKIPGRFDKVLEADPMRMREAITQASKVEWENGMTEINGVLVTYAGTPSPSVVARLCYLLSPLSVKMGSYLALTLETLPMPGDDPENPSLVTAKDGHVTFWQIGEQGAGAKIDESVFDYTAARALRVLYNEEDYKSVCSLDQMASRRYSFKYQKRESRSLGTEIGPVAVVGAPFATVYGDGQPFVGDFSDALSLWLASQRHGYMPYSDGVPVKFADVYPNRDRYFGRL